ncbi:MAG: hypothetical protein HQM08_00220 [Candidatus Riflebacteria bacterium]|nr:hypothetical protein [Candidatus Riflebacteria bacterium]
MSQKICPSCRDLRPSEELFCQHQIEGNTCGWDLSSEPIVIPETPSLPQDEKQVLRCVNGHPTNPGDLMCRVCGLDVAAIFQPSVDQNCNHARTNAIGGYSAHPYLQNLNRVF